MDQTHLPKEEEQEKKVLWHHSERCLHREYTGSTVLPLLYGESVLAVATKGKKSKLANYTYVGCSFPSVVPCFFHSWCRLVLKNHTLLSFTEFGTVLLWFDGIH